MLGNLIYAAAGSAWTVNVRPNTTGLPGNNVWVSRRFGGEGRAALIA